MEIYFVFVVCLFTTAAAQSDCGTTEFTDEIGEITSPNFPDFYTNNLDCDYNIRATETSSILLTFTRFIVEESQDFVTISCPTNSDFPSEVFTGTSLPNPVFIPMCSHALINFRTDDEFTNMGFRIEYNVTDQEGTTESGSTEFQQTTNELTTAQEASTAAETTESEQTTQELSTLPEITSEAATTELEETTLQFTTAQETTLTEAVTTDAITTEQETTIEDATTEFIETTPEITTVQESTLQVVTTESELTTEGLTTAAQESTIEDATTEVEQTSREISTAAADTTSVAGTTDFMQSSGPPITDDPACGDTSHYGPTGVISSPNYPFRYGFNLDCDYYVHASTGSSITFIFKAFSTEPNFDYVTISCPPNASFTAQRFSGSSLPDPVSISWCSLGLVNFHSDAGNIFTGFSLNYYVSYGGCGNTLYNETQEYVTSPNYPINYGDGHSCLNIIWAAERRTFHLNFLEFILHSCCNCDWLEVRCLDNLEYGPYKYCGTNNYGSMDIDQCSQLQLWFNSDSSLNAKGFNIEYNVNQEAERTNSDDGSVDLRKNSPPPPGGHELKSPRADVCGSGSSDNSSGVITSPNYPGIYTASEKCTHYINATPGSSIALVFEHFDVQLDKDYVTISCETNASFTEQRYTGHTIPPPLSVPWCSQGNLFFFSDTSEEYTGFSANYYISEGGCGNTVYTDSIGNVTSPNYPSNYGDFLDCYNIIWAPEPSHFYLEFVDFAVQGSEPCSLDWVEISCFDNNPSYKHRFCGSIVYPVDFYQCTQLLVRFHTDNITNDRGFTLEYNVEVESVCGDESYDGLWGNISSPNFPGMYNNSLSCDYNIYTSSPEGSIAIIFNEFYTEKCCDYVTISCATNSSYTPVEYSGYLQRLAVSIPWCSQGTVSFRTDLTIVSPGFNLEYYVSRGGCGDTLFAEPYGFISSPNYPGNYGENQNCSNIIWAEKAVSFTINFIYMNTEDCCDYVVISCLDNPTYGTHKFSGTTIPQTQIIPDCTQVLVWFHSDITQVANGFYLEYQQTPGSNKH